jgi:hypothetical protein
MEKKDTCHSRCSFRQRSPSPDYWVCALGRSQRPAGDLGTMYKLCSTAPGIPSQQVKGVATRSPDDTGR